jgi:hypothetical protein
VDDGVSVHHGGHTLDTEGLNVGLGQLAIDHLVPKIRVHERHLVERLNHIGAVRAAERDIGAQAHWPAEGLDPSSNPFIGQLAFAVAVEQGKDERGKLMPTRDAPEANPRRAPVAKNIELDPRHLLGHLTGRDLVTARSNLGKQLTNFSLLGVDAAIESQSQRGGQSRKVGLELGFDAWVQHGCS